MEPRHASQVNIIDAPASRHRVDPVDKKLISMPCVPQFPPLLPTTSTTNMSIESYKPFLPNAGDRAIHRFLGIWLVQSGRSRQVRNGYVCRSFVQPLSTRWLLSRSFVYGNVRPLSSMLSQVASTRARSVGTFSFELIDRPPSWNRMISRMVQRIPL